MHIPDVDFHLSKMFIGFSLLDKRGFICLRMFQALMREKYITPPAHRFRHMILRESVDEIDITPQHILDACHLLDDEIAVMHHKLQIEGGNGSACLTSTGCPAV